MYVNIHTYTHTHTHTYIHTYIHTFTVHSDDGNFFHCNLGRDFKLTFKSGDTIGCGFRLDDGDPVLFFTKVGRAMYLWLYACMYVCMYV